MPKKQQVRIKVVVITTVLIIIALEMRINNYRRENKIKSSSILGNVSTVENSKLISQHWKNLMKIISNKKYPMIPREKQKRYLIKSTSAMLDHSKN